ncbi:hypothetical protein GCM10010869_19040 [Mesorhizobium tianshanense]|uniref:Alanyl-tRNA synthetase n=1 Tax=Mesorhizobium tianshanense TaxID=39844 RepID=A0A562N3Y4_9HYPH|nr:metal-dependent hydrolase [Mesorhizobium tianshanense]TWI26798.1 alanyl-tRNA synthetase [Mesorhizobium tianshanense]GLS36315.1 hypothetical protein GCM10010869_19040 [Mesorhizobium tianshanense]
MKFDTSMKTGTLVTFPGGALAGQGRIEFAAPCVNGWLVIADRTPVHPVSFRWPDQPADLGQITFADGVVVEIADAWTGLIDAGAGVLLIGEEAKAVRKGEGEWQGVVVHIVQSDRDLGAYIGEEARFTVEPRRRKALSVPHTAAHLAALALNAASVPFWTKDFADLDSLGRPNLDKAAIENSSIEPAVSTDVYRLGKSLRKKGFDRDGFLNNLETVGVEINGMIRRWLETNTLVSLTPSEGLLDGIRQWRCNLDGTEVIIPCGGTHVERLSDIGDVKITLAPSEEGFVMTTQAREA